MKSTIQQSVHIASAPNGPAYVFTGAVDGEWTNLKNWEDASGNSPASALPDSSSTVIITGLVDTIPDSITAEVDTLTINDGAEIRITISAASANVRGIIGLGEKSCGNGVLQMRGTDAARFYTGSNNLSQVNGNATFYGNSTQEGSVSGIVRLEDSSSMIQRANGDPPQCLDLMMYDQSIAAGCIVNRYLNMYGMSHIEHNITIHDFVYITDNAYLKGPGIMTNPPNKLINFDQSAYIGEDYTVVGNCIFQLPWNFNYGTIQGNLSAYGGGLPARLGNVTGTATLTDDIYDDLFLP